MITHFMPARPGSWALHLSLIQGPPGEVLRIEGGGRTFLTVARGPYGLTARFDTDIADNPRFPEKHILSFEITSRWAKQVTIQWHPHAVRLMAGGELADEEWPIGTLPEGNWRMVCGDQVACVEFKQIDAAEAESAGQFTGPMQFFLPPGHNTGTGDCMPFSRDGRYCLYYLFDRRGHQSKGGLGAHQWAQISSADLKSWTIHPMAIPVTEQWEGSICTGSLIQKEGKIYAFYAARTSDGSPARMSWAVSEDGVHFEKSGKTFALTDPYEPVSARDPMVFSGADGLYHMLVTTSLPSAGRYGGCLAHLTSSNLTDWTQREPFIVPGYADQPECSDYFEWNGWYYLVFSNFATARYRMSRSPFGPWIRPAYDILDSVENQVPKTAAFGNRRLLTGFLAKYPRTYAGNAVTHELFQRPDGTLGVKFPEEILPPPAGPKLLTAGLELNAGEGRAEAALAAGLRAFRARLTLRSKDGALFGLRLSIADREYRIDMDPAARRLSVLRPDQHFSRGEARNQVLGVDLSGDVEVDLIAYGDVLDMTFAGGCAHVMRLADDVGEGTALYATAQAGTAYLLRSEITPLSPMPKPQLM